VVGVLASQRRAAGRLEKGNPMTMKAMTCVCVCVSSLCFPWHRHPPGRVPDLSTCAVPSSSSSHSPRASALPPRVLSPCWTRFTSGLSPPPRRLRFFSFLFCWVACLPARRVVVSSRFFFFSWSRSLHHPSTSQRQTHQRNFSMDATKGFETFEKSIISRVEMLVRTHTETHRKFRYSLTHSLTHRGALKSRYNRKSVFRGALEAAKGLEKHVLARHKEKPGGPVMAVTRTRTAATKTVS